MNLIHKSGTDLVRQAPCLGSVSLAAFGSCKVKETKAECKRDEREGKTMSNSASNDTNRPTMSRVETQLEADTAIAAFVSELQQGWDHPDAAISNRYFAA